MYKLRRFMPSPEALQRNRWLRWLGPRLLDPGLWRFSRRGLALGMSLGIFFGLLIPVAQMPLSAAAAVLLRANLPAAVASTLVTNPVTFGPVYYAAWRLGKALLGEPVGAGQLPPAPPAAAALPAGAGVGAAAAAGWWAPWQQRLLGVGKPLLLGLSILACGLSVLTYFAVSWTWTLQVWWTRRRRRRAVARDMHH
ncbi:MAG: DUF2062 domain-containing protein [Rubrivivax sp.]|nr:DUF2062 domain-containing protein [Rubrivivax sp.]